MSRLSRFKKNVVVKLPPMRNIGGKTKADVPQDDDFDDDFQDLPSVPKSKPASMIAKVFVEKPSKSGTSQDSTIESIYFNTDGNIASIKCSGKAESQDNDEQKPVQPKKSRAKKKVTKQHEALIGSFLKDSDHDSEPSDVDTKVVCPFCWKKLGDKLSGTTHVKSCGKNLPTARIFEALQLHEKQVKEWEGLGIAYPGFAPNGKTTKAKSSKPSSRQKKNKDPELELAMALSVSLHEELESRKLEENKFLIESGLEKEVKSMDAKPPEFVPPVVSYRQRPEKTSKSKANGLVSQDGNMGKRRGKKDVINLKETKLYTTTETERQNIINERVGIILEESSKTKHEEFYVRDKIILPDDVPKRLKAFHKENSPLWKLAELDNEKDCVDSADKFVIQDVTDSKIRNECELAKQTVTKNVAASSEKKEKLSTDNISNKTADKKRLRTSESFSLSESPFCNPIRKTDNVNVSSMISQKDRPNHSTSSVASSYDIVASSLESRDSEYPQVVYDLLKLLSKKAFTDITLFGREEKPIKCHKLMLRARCPKILEDVVTSPSSSSGKDHEMICLVGYSHNAVKAFITFIYSGRIKQSLTPDDLQDLKAIADFYGVQLISDEPPPKRLKRVSTEIQTELITIARKCAFTQTEGTMTDEVIYPRNAKADFSSSNIFEESKISVENGNDDGNCLPDHPKSQNNLFDDTTDNLLQNVDERHCSNSEAEKSRLIEIAEEDVGNISEDMFGEFEDDNDAFLNEMAKDIEDQENQFENCSANKRTRSISQLSNDSTTSFTATQAALYWRKQLNKQKSVEEEYVASPCKNTSPSHKKIRIRNSSESENESANETLLDKNISEAEVITIDSDKDNETIYENNDCPKENVPIGEKDSDNDVNSQSDASLSWKDTYANSNISVNEMDNVECQNENASIKSPGQSISAAICDTPKYRSLCNRTRNHHFTPIPRLSVENVRRLSEFSPSYSPLNSTRISKNSPTSNNHMDTFGDDSLFANIPEEVLNQQVDSNDQNLVTEPELSPVTSQVSQETSKKGRGKSQAKGKTKARAKIKLPPSKKTRTGQRGHSYSQEPQSNSKTPTNDDLVLDGRTPMLNYSTIDTPILKNELKRFGLKPLPRTKAKVLLRHIHKETHK